VVSPLPIMFKQMAIYLLVMLGVGSYEKW